MTDILNTGKSALFAFQRALATTAHNIANVDTDGYTRQRVEFSAIGNADRGPMHAGSGVRVDGVQRIHDQFATTRVNSATSAHAEQQSQFELASRLDDIVASEGVSVAPAINDFFNALQDASNDASSVSAREVVLDQTEQLANRFRLLQGQLDDTQNEVNNRTRAAIDAVDEYAEGIREINNQIITFDSSSQLQVQNDLLDQRDQMVKELSGLIEVTTVEQDNGALNVFIGKGINLVVEGSKQKISAVADETHPDRLKIQISGNGVDQEVDALLQGGEIGGLQSFAAETLHPTMHHLGRLAMVLSDELNQQHAMGVDLDGERGSALFEIPEPTAFSSGDNSGTGLIAATVVDTNLLEPAEYVLRYDGVDFTTTRSSDGAVTTGSLPLSIDGIELSITGSPAAGDTFVVSATGRAAASMNALISDPETLALSGPLATTSSIENLGDSQISAATVTDQASTTLQDPVDIVFSSDTTYDIVDVNTGSTLVSGAAYTPGETISQNGWEVSIQGDALSGDTHRIEANTMGRGNNTNGLAMVDKQLESLVDGTQSFNDAYGALVSTVGAHTHSAQSRTSALEALLDNAIDRQQAVQGVSLDEEAVDLTRFQQAYQASAQIIATADTMFKTILNAVQ
jgi:flagellar hook-associated protein 1 FlgK